MWGERQSSRRLHLLFISIRPHLIMQGKPTMKEKNDPLRPLRPNPHNLRITYELFNRHGERMFLAPLCVDIGRGADDVLDLREGDAVVYESDDCEGRVSPDGADWTADAEEEEEEGPEYHQSCWKK